MIKPANKIYIGKWGCLVQVGNGIELDTVGRMFDGALAWDVVQTVVVMIKMRPRTSAFLIN